MILSLLTPLLGYIIAAVAALGAVLGVYLKARSDGAKSVEVKVLKGNLEDEKKLNEAAADGPKSRDDVLKRMSNGLF